MNTSTRNAKNTLGTLLIVDDVVENITTLSGMLRDSYQVLFATGGEEALAIVRERHIDLILLDVMMPVMDGYEVCRRLKADIQTRDIPVIFVTAMVEIADESRGLELGAVDYLRKPCHPTIVRRRVQLHLEQHHQHLALERLVQERTSDLAETRLQVVQRLGRAAEFRDNETGMHVLRMSHTSRLLALEVGLPVHAAELILHAAPMHDIGKIGIPDAILLKPGPLDAQEWAVMQKHAQIGADIIGEHPSELLTMARVIALTHHERWDGAGYPRKMAGDDIPLEGRIVAIADVFDALTSARPYKKAWSTEAALDHMQAQSGRQFDPRLLACFLELAPDIEKISARYSDTHGGSTASTV